MVINRRKVAYFCVLNQFQNVGLAAVKITTIYVFGSRCNMSYLTLGHHLLCQF